VVTSEGKRPLGRTSQRNEDNIKIDFWEVEGGAMEHVELSQDRDIWGAHVTAVMDILVT
jgi:hypothetical protein